MKKTARRMMYLLMCLVLTLALGMTMTSLGASSKEDDDEDEINGCTLTVKAEITANTDLGTLTVTASSTRYSVQSYNFVGAGSDWEPGDIPKVKVIVDAEPGYRFSTKVATGTVKCSGSGSYVTGVKRLDRGESLEVTIRLKAVKGEMGEIKDAFWVTSPLGKAKWDEADNASAYRVKLYRNDTCIKTVDKTLTTYYDFYPYMTKAGNYTFRVCPVPRSGETEYLNDGEWTVSDVLYIDRTKVASGGATDIPNPDTTPGSHVQSSQDNHVPFGWVRDGSGWWYHENDGGYPAGGWSFIDGRWYLFDVGGYMKTGWQEWNKQYYYLTSNGDMATGWVQDNRKWYYLDPNQGGIMRTGWLDADGQRYYLYGDGSRATGWQLLNNKWYYFDPNTGAMARDTVVGEYRLDSEGVWVQ